MTTQRLHEVEELMLQQLDLAIASTAQRLRESQGGGPLEGFALCTDEDMRSLYAAGFTGQAAQAHVEDDYRYRPAEWPETNELDGASELLSQLAESYYEQEDDYNGAWKKRLMGRVVDLLERHRAIGTFQADALVLFVSHDCGDPFFEWMEEGVKRLNSASHHELWRKHF